MQALFEVISELLLEYLPSNFDWFNALYTIQTTNFRPDLIHILKIPEEKIEDLQELADLALTISANIHTFFEDTEIKAKRAETLEKITELYTLPK